LNTETEREVKKIVMEKEIGIEIAREIEKEIPVKIETLQALPVDGLNKSTKLKIW
jgi:hypothetical protein